MISFLTGTVHAKAHNTITLLTSGGVGYDITLTGVHAAELSLGKNIELHTHLKVSEQAMDLYGFRTTEEKSFFSLLLSVSGVGPKSAMNILAIGSIHDIEDAIVRADAKYLSAVQGIGKKTAERMVVELKTKIQKSTGGAQARNTAGGNILEEVIDGLVSMGYSKEDARAAALSCDADGKSTEQLLRDALQIVAK
ncbi:MAG TPA: Holliday junction branch migration protein RuvA [Candidatus Magasanikbacteria bacterium]|nr:Holliday junction branch migration protein RuvA [Candidatus Magasanikbacteria bacterium]